MKHKSTQKTILPDFRFKSYNDWVKYIHNELNKIKK